jgi:NitT/TauT family transport system substrate-binding protein
MMRAVESRGTAILGRMHAPNRRVSPVKMVSRSLAACACAWLAACSDSSPAAKPGAAGSAGAPAATKVRIQLNWVPEPEFGGIYAAAQDGLFSKEGLDVEIIKGSAGTPAAQMAASGQVEFAVTSGDQILSLREQGGNLVGLFAIFHTSPMGIMVPDASPFRSLEALWHSDATVAMEAGLPFVRYLNLKYPGGKVKLVPTGTGLAAFERGAVAGQQAFISSEPVQMELKKVPVRFLSLAEGGYDPYTVTVATSSSYLERERATCAAFVRALRKGWTRYLAEPAKYNAEIARLNPAMGIEAMAIAAEMQHDLVAPPKGSADEVGWMPRERWERLAAQLKELGMIKEPPASIDAVFWNAPK